MFFTDIILGTFVVSALKATWGFWNINSDNDTESKNHTPDESHDSTSYTMIPQSNISSLPKDQKDEIHEEHSTNTEGVKQYNSIETGCVKSSAQTADYKRNKIFNRIINAISHVSENSINEIEDAMNLLKKYYPIIRTKENDWKNDIEQNVNQLICDFHAYIKKLSSDERYKDLFKQTNADVLTRKISRLKQFFMSVLSPKDEKTLLDVYIMDIYPTDEEQNNFADSLSNGLYPILYADNNTFHEIVKEKERYQIPSYKPILNYQTLLGMAGVLYNKLHTAYFQCGLIPSEDFFSNELVYEIATKIIERSDFYFCHNLTINQLAHDITDSIIDYIHNSLADRSKQKELLIPYLVRRYLGARLIRNYYYYLKMCAKIYESALNKKIYSTQCAQNDGNGNYIFSDNVISFKISDLCVKEAERFTNVFSIDILSEIVRYTQLYNYSFLCGLKEEDIMHDILLTFYSRENLYKREIR
ncbi:MAG: hypothetical protein NC453_12105 [Muribaculum sp.]|nr:hypothetical protein [Muribaculum sp.]